jgi:hypothetical protein
MNMDEIKPIQKEEEPTDLVDALIYGIVTTDDYVHIELDRSQETVTIPRQWIEQAAALLDIHGKGTKQQVKEILKGWIK